MRNGVPRHKRTSAIATKRFRPRRNSPPRRVAVAALACTPKTLVILWNPTVRLTTGRLVSRQAKVELEVSEVRPDGRFSHWLSSGSAPPVRDFDGALVVFSSERRKIDHDRD